MNVCIRQQGNSCTPWHAMTPQGHVGRIVRISESPGLRVVLAALCAGPCALHAQVSTTGNDQGFGMGQTSLGNVTCVAIGGSGSFNGTATCDDFDSLAVGNGAQAVEQAAVALGASAVASGSFALALGANSTAAGASAFAVGRDSNAAGSDAMAIGRASLASTTNALALGAVANAGGANAIALGSAANASNAGDVALGAGSTTDAVSATGSYAIRGTSYGFAGATPVSTVSVGAPGAERTITHVAAGRIGAASTDAINGSQLYAVTQSLESLSLDNTAHYFSVNDGGSPRTNYVNDGATAAGALAAGISAQAVGTDGVALGARTLAGATRGTVAVGADASADSDYAVSLGALASVRATAGVALGEGSLVDAAAGAGSIALGSAAVADRGLAPAAGSVTAGTHLIPYNTADRTLAGALSVGSATTFRQITNVADGTADQDAVTLRQLKGALVSFSVTPTEYFHANSTAPDSLAVGADSVAIGPRATVDGDRGIGLGQGATVQQTAPGGMAIGEGAAVALADGVALGTRATSNAIQGVAIGAGAVAGAPGSVALGAGSTTEGAVATTGATLAGTFFAFAGAAPSSTVSIGTSGAERTLTHLAAGRIAADSTDGINGSQLFATNQTVEALHAQLGSIAAALGNLPPAAGAEVPTFASSQDNSSTATASGSDSTAVGAGAVATGDNSVALGAGSIATQPNTVSVGATGRERTITHVSPGVDPTDAVNVGQLSDAVANAKDWSRSYTDQRFATVDRDLNRIGNRANAGIASAMAMAGLPQAYGANQNSAGIALGTFHGESSVAVGLSAITESGRYIFKLSASTNSRGDAGASVGAGVVW